MTGMDVIWKGTASRASKQMPRKLRKDAKVSSKKIGKKNMLSRTMLSTTAVRIPSWSCKLNETVWFEEVIYRNQLYTPAPTGLVAILLAPTVLFIIYFLHKLTDLSKGKTSSLDDAYILYAFVGMYEIYDRGLLSLLNVD